MTNDQTPNFPSSAWYWQPISRLPWRVCANQKPICSQMQLWFSKVLLQWWSLSVQVLCWCPFRCDCSIDDRWCSGRCSTCRSHHVMLFATHDFKGDDDTLETFCIILSISGCNYGRSIRFHPKLLSFSAFRTESIFLNCLHNWTHFFLTKKVKRILKTSTMCLLRQVKSSNACRALNCRLQTQYGHGVPSVRVVEAKSVKWNFLQKSVNTLCGS